MLAKANKFQQNHTIKELSYCTYITLMYISAETRLGLNQATNINLLRK